MGSIGNEKGRDEDEQRHKVTLKQDFWMAQTELTIEQFCMLVSEVKRERIRTMIANLQKDSKLPITGLNRMVVVGILAELPNGAGKRPCTCRVYLPAAN